MTAVDEWDDVTVDDFRRDQWDRPLILQADGTRIGYTRSSTAAKTIEDTYNLERWARRNIAYGMTYDGSLVARLLAIGSNPAGWGKAEKDAVNKICEDAEKVAQAYKGADIGTALHHLTHRLDRGEQVDAGPYAADLDAYVNTYVAHGLCIDERYIECRIVNDLLRMAGSADRIVEVDGIYRIADIKTGATVDFGALGWSAQLAAYAGGVLYDVVTEQRLPTPPIDQTIGYIVHLPAGQGRCDIYEIDLVAGHRAAELANQIRTIRREAKSWLQPKSTWVAAPSPPPGKVEQQAGEDNGPSSSSPAEPSAADTDLPLSVAQPAPTPSAGVGAPIATPADQSARRQGLLHRYHKLSEPDQKRFNARKVPDMPLDWYERLLEQIERTANRSHDVKPAPGWTHTPTPPPDEGDMAHVAEIAAVKIAYNKLPGEAQQWVCQLIVEGNNANLPWSTGTLHSERRYQLGRAVVALAPHIHAPRYLEDDTIGTLLACAADRPELEEWWETTTLGAAIGALNAEEATRFATLVDEYLTP